MKILKCLLVVLTGLQSAPVFSQTMVISDVRIVNVRDGSILGPMNILVSDGKIVDVSRDDNLKTRPGAVLIDGKGKYAIPGLSEMHAHIPSPDQGEAYVNEVLFLYLSNGITNIRGMLGHESHLELRQKAIDNTILSPRIYTSSPSLNGTSIPTAEVARERVREYARKNYDFLKIHPGIKLEVFQEIVKAAEQEGIEFSGHVPVDVGIRKALAFEFGTVDHIDGFLEGMVPEEARVDPQANGFFGYNFTDLVDLSMLPSLVQLTRENDVWVVPTQSLFERWFSPLDAEKLAKEREMRYLPGEMIDNWVRSKNELVSNDSYTKAQYTRFNTIRLQMIKALHDGGVGLLLGSDAPQVFNVPGFSIHHEIAGMRKAGLSNLDILRMGTVNPARYMGMEGQFGEIIRGASADLFLVNSDPFEDIAVLREVQGVMVRGIWLSKSDIDTRLKEIANKYN